MPLSWNEIEARALTFAKEWEKDSKLSRIEFLFGFYEEYTTPMFGGEVKKKKGGGDG